MLTWNLWWRFGDWQQRLKAIDAVLQEVQPDICCFQEVWSTDSEDAAARLGEQNGLPYVARSYSPEPERWQQWIDQPGVDYGNAIVSRWPITASHVRDLPGAHGRTALAARIATPAGAEIPVVCTHLAAHPAASAERCAQVRVVVDVVDALGRRDLPPVVAGDLNAEPDSDEVRLLSGCKTAPAVAGLFLVDAWRGADDADPGWTWRRENPHTSKFGLNARIDYIHVGAFGPNGEGTIRQVRLAGHREVDGVWPSDHAAVVADLAMP